MVTGTLARGPWDSWSTPQAVGPETEWHGRSGRIHGNSGTGPSPQGELVEPAVPRTRARVAQINWMNTRSFGKLHKSPGTAGRPWETLHQGPSPSSPGQLVDHVGPRNLAQGAQDRWSTAQAIGPVPEMPSRAGRSHGPLYPIAFHPGQLVDPTETRTRDRVAQESWSTPWPL